MVNALGSPVDGRSGSEIPIGRGQRALIIGDRKTVVGDAKTDVVCVYGAIGQKSRPLQRWSLHRVTGSFGFTILGT